MTELLVTLGLLAGLVVSHELGFWLGSATKSVDELFDRQVVLVRASTAALVAFLIGFAFSGAAARFIDRDRVKLLSREGRERIEPLLARVGGLHERMWKTATRATQDNAPLMSVMLPPINKVIDLHSEHLAMARRHLPIPIMVTLLGAAAIGVGMIGFGNGRIGRRFSVLDSVYGAVLAAALWMTIDLDYPGLGLIRVSNRMVVETLGVMN
ncbi:hypothetical protein SAMN05216330_11965 [Bradyrhizobium sp. Ghvi]|uniref:hypothetical protein n=1 Tax=Bradyrhizobium sp. Ghvi TaxID=1855319 RepID=UPI0008E57199|nr:hypothetical protein [Bradyrhizobium sp. Ghvi]SFQ21788.1 hypothetical protein SAMN05216330_11965 [Bradyrhizobium sp. Ghvi]